MVGWLWRKKRAARNLRREDVSDRHLLQGFFFCVGIVAALVLLVLLLKGGCYDL